MNYEEFLSQVCQGVVELIGEEDMQGRSVNLQKVMKNNDVELDALVIACDNDNASPTIYLNHYYDELMDGRDFDDIIDEIFGLYCRHSVKLKFNVEQFRDYEKVKDKIVFKIISLKSNKKRLKSIPHIKFLDFAIVFYCLFDEDELGDATILIHKAHMDMWNIKINKLYKIARENTVRMLPAEISDIDDIVRDLIVSDINKNVSTSDIVKEEFENQYGSVDEVAEDIMKDIHEIRHNMKMYVLTNKKKLNGAACILYDDVLKNFANELHTDIYILPSSIHEVILVPVAPDINKSALDEMVKEVNREELEISDILSDHAYIYSRDDGQIHM